MIRIIKINYQDDIESEFHTEVLQATTSEELAQGPYLVAKMGFEPATLQTHRTEPPRPITVSSPTLCNYCN